MSYGIFTPDMKQTHTILVPGMLDIHFRLFPAIFETTGYHVEVLYNEGDEVVEEGLSHVHNDTCYPALLVIGQMIAALKSGKYDLNKVALAITQTGGGCRASNYIFLLRKALEHEGWEHIPVLSVNFSGLEKENSVELTLPLGKKLLYAFLYGDAIMWLKNQVKPYEVEKGSAQALADRWTERLALEMTDGGRLSYRRVKDNYRRILDDFAAGAAGCIADFDQISSVIRSREISVSIILQSLAQLEAAYGHDKAVTILSNCDHLLYLGGQELATARYISVKANKSVHTILNMPLNHAWLFTRGDEPKVVEKYRLEDHPLYHLAQPSKQKTVCREQDEHEA